MALCFNPGSHIFEVQDPVSWSGLLVHSENLVQQAFKFESRQSYRQQLKNGRGIPREGIASVSVSFYGIEPSGRSLLSFRDSLLALPVTARRFIAGAVAGALSKVATGPIEAVRVQAMTTGDPLLAIATRTFTRGGLLGFFAGVEADILKTGPSKAIEFAAFDLYKRLLAQKDPLTGEWRSPGPAALSVAGALAGVTSTLMVAPLDTLRTRMAHEGHQYRHLVDALQQTVADGGAGALYRGLGASLIGVIPYAAVRLTMYDVLKSSYQRMTGDTPPPQVLALFGAASAVAATAASFPLEVVRRRAMVGKCSFNTFAALRTIAKTEGTGALYKGMVLTWAKQAPQYAVQMMVYDMLKQSLFVDNRRTEQS
eukprot:jgi/Botrbrau1/12824/Bobra.20_1s0014.1